MSAWQHWGAAQWAPHLAGLGVSAAAAHSLGAFLAMLGRFSRALDLVGNIDADALVRDHVRESLAALPLLPQRGRLLDLGSGNGFPAVPLLVVRPELAGTLLEPRERRWAFLREVVRELGLDAEVRREAVEAHRAGDYAAVTVRALGAATWAGHLERLLAPGGVLVWWTTATALPGTATALLEPVVPSALPEARRGVLAAWRRRST